MTATQKARQERFHELVDKRDYSVLMDELLTLGVKSVKLSEMAAEGPPPLPEVTLNDVVDLLPCGDAGPEEDEQNRLLRHAVLYGAAESGTIEERVPLAELERWRAEGVLGWPSREGLAVKMFEARMMKLLTMIAVSSKSKPKDAQAVIKLLEGVNPERWARERRLTGAQDDPIASFLALAWQREKEHAGGMTLDNVIASADS